MLFPHPHSCLFSLASSTNTKLCRQIITDLFPGVEPPKVDYDALLAALGESCGELRIQPVDSFIHKVIQARP